MSQLKRSIRLRTFASWCIAIAVAALLVTVFAGAQNAGQQSQPKSTQQAPAEAGGPTGDIGPIAVPKTGEKKPDEEPKPAPKATKDQPEFTLTKDVPLVTLDVSVQTKDGHFVPGLKQGNFRIL